ncbi:MAG: NADH-quinone oxidoreductase subunit M [Candidatus Marinimicrobia bacterium]|nr:NADH-quinone oxidoreductase subunit M [Candidatus Neomarinimicrobiota bacterium]MCF7830255.1 NADH-quinone oxidoreductase subunit M [Candidatus Neomarinimicrobiota bacterium]MCF7882282.1 NADH-quinone oxidoreductase subunit M [Candidatus Neomarinimicrobiota bacterium]
MILVWLILIPIIGGVLAWILDRQSKAAGRWVSLIAMVIDLGLAVYLWIQYFDKVEMLGQGAWLAEFQWDWIPQYGISFYLALDGLSLLMILLTGLLGILSIMASWTEIQERSGFFHFNLMWILGGIIGVFMAMDLFLFYFFWEMMLIPMYFLIAIWGHENRIYASIKFFIFTQASGLLMLVAILGLYFVHHAETGVYTFNYMELLGTSMAPNVAMWLMLGFFIAFITKLPAFPVHTWLPDAHTEAPTAGSVILAGLMLKTGAYGLLRFVLPLFPGAAATIAPYAMFLGVVGILYGAILAFAQNDLKRLVAYTSVSHLGFVLLGIFAMNEIAIQGAVMTMIAHGLSTGGLFILVGGLYEKIHTRDMDRMGGLWDTVPKMGTAGMFLAMASLGLPGLGNFVGEMLALFGAYQANIPLTVFATIGLVFATVYSLWVVQRAFHGKPRESWGITDFGGRHITIMAVMAVVLVWLGLYPKPVLDTAKPAVQNIEQSVRIQTISEKTTPANDANELSMAEVEHYLKAELDNEDM